MRWSCKPDRRAHIPHLAPLFDAIVAQSVEQGFCKAQVVGSTPSDGSIYGRCIHRGRGRCLLNSWVGESRLGIVLSSFRHLRGCRLHLRTPTFLLETWPTRNHQPLHFGCLGNGQSPTLRTSFSVGSSPTAPATFIGPSPNLVWHIVRDDAQCGFKSRRADHFNVEKIKTSSHLLWWRTFSWCKSNSHDHFMHTDRASERTGLQNRGWWVRSPPCAPF